MDLEKASFIGENFDIADVPVALPNQVHLMNLRDYLGPNIEENVETFEQVFRPLHREGYLLYHRRVSSAMGPRVSVFDHLKNRHQEMLMFGSNNYLGFANDPQIKAAVSAAIQEYGVGMAGPMILNGSGDLQKILEQEIARFKGKEDAVVLPTGYQANLAWVNSLLSDDAVLLYDEASHASLIDGIRLGRKKAFRFSEQNLNSLEDLFKKFRFRDSRRDIFVSVQGVFSMSGEISNLKEISYICEKYRGFLVVDDAHGTGVLGGGKGTAEHFGIVDKLKLTMGTFSKAFAVTGGFLAGDAKTINFIRFFARSYFFTASLPPMVCAAVLKGVDIIRNQPERVAKVHANASYLRERLKLAGIRHTNTGSAIVPIFPPVIGKFREIAREIHEQNLFVNPIEPPAVPVGNERFRMSVMATHSTGDVDAAVEILQRVFKKFNA
ncbi:MAG: hypothetical protein A4S09_13860 [Proteobacteria bacterium SG_bin7]|nr:MAG: hypothetical protein A4S09_13860 [Proteobacteria bacterium SG_bin7]